MRRAVNRALDGFPFLLIAALIAVWVVQCGDDALQTGDGDGDAGDTGHDAALDVADEGGDDAGDDATGDADAAADLADEEIIVPTCFEEDGERPVGSVCAQETNRICLDDAHCRDTEMCEVPADDEAFGTCIYEIPDPIECPGGPTCPDGDPAPLQAGFAVRTITPLGWEMPREGFVDGRGFIGDPEDPETFFDCGRDMICPEDDDYEGPDADGSEGDEFMQGVWMAGLNESVPALLCPAEQVGEDCQLGVDCCVHERAHDDIWARGVIFSQGTSRVAYVAVDLIGYFYSDVQDVAAELDEALGIDLLIVSSTHAHEGPDSMGLWGPGSFGSDLPALSGVDPGYIEYVRAQILDLLDEAADNLVDVDVYATSVHTGVEEVAGNDTRDPWIFNDNMALMHVVAAGADRAAPDNTVGVLVNWGNHPESIGSNNNFISSDYPHYVRTYIEEGLPQVMNGEEVVEAVPGMGGPVVFMSGTLGGLTTPLRTTATARDGTVVGDNGFAKAEAMGGQLAQIALEALADAPAITGELSFGLREMLIGVPNLRFHIAIFSLDLFPDREIYNWRFEDGFGAEDPPQLLTALGRVQIGEVSFATVPGEMFPETVVGGFSAGDSQAGPVRGDPNLAACTDDGLPPTEPEDPDAIYPCVIDPGNPNPPAIDEAPDGGFIDDVLPGDVLFLIGNGLDSIGYFVPAYDFELSEGAPYVSEAPGDHYEETNGVGPVLRQLLDEMALLWDVESLFE